MGRLGRMYRDGKGIEKNAEEAIKWMQMATEKNVDWMKELKVLTQS
jgi:FOG: TPR repeat, SEL1 subfamily